MEVKTVTANQKLVKSELRGNQTSVGLGRYGGVKYWKLWRLGWSCLLPTTSLSCSGLGLDGDQEALEKLTPLVYQQLHRVAQRYMAGQRPGHTLQTTALVNEVYLRLVDCAQVNWQDRAHFLAVSAQLMRRILIDFARSRGYQKRGGHAPHICLEDAPSVSNEPDANIVALDDALKALAKVDDRKSRVVELRFFGGPEY